MRIFFQPGVFSVCVYLLILSTGQAVFAVDDPGKSVRIIRDTWGVPHIYADDHYSLFYGYGYAVAQDRLFQMEMIKRTTAGTVAEVLGEQYLELDKTVRRGFDPDSLRQQIDKLSAQHRAVFAGYAQGLNAWIKEVNKSPGRLMPKEFIDFGFVPSTWTAYDVVLVFAGSMAHRYADFNEEINNLAFYQQLVKQHGQQRAWKIFNATLPVYDMLSPTTVADEDNAGTEERRYRGDKAPSYLAELIASNVRPEAALAFQGSGRYRDISDEHSRRDYIRYHLGLGGIPGRAGFSSASNVWLVGRQKTRGAQGLLVNGPQFGWINPSYVYGVGLHGAGFNVVGNTLFAYPFMLFAHNGDISWGSTAGFGDLVDIYVSRLNPDNAEQYYYQGAYRRLDKRVEQIKVKGGPTHQSTFYRSVYGPVVLMDVHNGVIYSKKRSWEGSEVATGVAWVELSKAKDYASWRRQLADMSTNINFYFLDRKGNIAYTHTGKYPARKSGHDNRLPVPGDGSMDWPAYLPFEKNPHVYNPKQGYITNWNNRPAHGWRNSDLWWRRWGKAERVDILIAELERKETFTSAELWDINSRSSFADVNRAYLLPVLQKALSEKPASATVTAALHELVRWDGYWWDKNEDGLFDSAGPMMMQTWLTRLSEQVLKDDIGEEYFFRFASPGYPVEAIRASIPVSPGIKMIVNNIHQMGNALPVDYDFFNGRAATELLRETFIDAINELSGTLGTDRKHWRLKPYPHVFSAFNFRGVAQTAEDNTFSLPVIMNRGTENNLFVAKDNTITGRDVFAPGQSGFIAPDGGRSAHYSDQLDLYWRFKHKPLPFTLKQLQAMQETEVVLEVDEQQTGLHGKR